MANNKGNTNPYANYGGDVETTAPSVSAKSDPYSSYGGTSDKVALSSPNAGLASPNKLPDIKPYDDALSGVNDVVQGVKGIAASKPVQATLTGAGAFLKKIGHFNPVESTLGALGGGGQLSAESMLVGLGSSQEAKQAFQKYPEFYDALTKERPDLIAALDRGEFKNKRVNTVTGAVEDATPSSVLNAANDIASPVIDTESFRKGEYAKGIGDTLANLYGLVRGGQAARKTAFVEPESALSATPSQTENLNALRATNNRHVNYDATKEVAPEVRNAAAKIAGEEQANTESTIPKPIADVLNNAKKPPQLSFKGKNVEQRLNAARQVTRAAQGAIDDHEQQVQSVTEPFQDSTASMKPAADAVRAHITPELEAAAKVNPSAATDVNRLNALADELDSNAALRDINAKRQRFNDILAPEYDKAEAKQVESPVVTQAMKDAVNKLRDIQYGTISDLSGNDIRPLMRKEGQLIEYKADVNRRLASAANSPENVVAPYGQRVKNAATRFAPGAKNAHTTFDLAKTVLGGRPTTPIEDFNANAAQGLSDLGQHEPASPITIPTPIRRAIFDYEGARPGEPEIVRPDDVQNAQGGREVPLANGGGVLRRPQLLLTGDVPQPSGNATPEFTYPNGTRGDVLANRSGSRVPRQLSAVVNKGLLPAKASPIPLPAQSDTTVVGGRNIEVPRTGTVPEGAVPQIIREFLERQSAQQPKPNNGTQQPATSTLPKQISELVAPPVERINVIHPSGAPGTIPANQLREALAQGFRLETPLVA